jgi:membrane protease YdiL (CAAX protease family)
MLRKIRNNSSLSALLEIGIMFLPSIPAFLWIWPNLSKVQTDIFQAIVYVYILVGTVFIGRRHWTWEALGINRNGLWLSLVCGVVILAARLLIILGIEWGIHPPPLTWLSLTGDILFYFLLVGLVEELLFRGLIYRLLEDWGGVYWAIWGSSLGFSLWHVFGQGLVVGLATFLIGLLFALIRWRAGGILGLIVIHALWDLETSLLVADSNAELLNPERFSFNNPAMIWMGTLLLILVPVYLWKIYPLLHQRRGFV